MTDLSTVRSLGPVGLYKLFQQGSSVDPSWLQDREFHGWSVGQPRIVTRLTWLHFKKVFRREPDGRLRGWNVAVAQDGSFQDVEQKGIRSTYGHYEVVHQGHRTVIDYRLGGNLRRDPLGLLVDPIVTLTPGSADLLLGYTEVGVPTPTFFALVPGEPLTYAVQPPRPSALQRGAA